MTTASAPPDHSTLSLHDALPICDHERLLHRQRPGADAGAEGVGDIVAADVEGHEQAEGDREDLEEDVRVGPGDRKSTRLNSSHVAISYAVFCLKKKKCRHDVSEV